MLAEYIVYRKNNAANPTQSDEKQKHSESTPYFL